MSKDFKKAISVDEADDSDSVDEIFDDNGDVEEEEGGEDKEEEEEEEEEEGNADGVEVFMDFLTTFGKPAIIFLTHLLKVWYDRLE